MCEPKARAMKVCGLGRSTRRSVRELFVAEPTASACRVRAHGAAGARRGLADWAEACLLWSVQRGQAVVRTGRECRVARDGSQGIFDFSENTF